jgi:hypothetical protein
MADGKPGGKGVGVSTITTAVGWVTGVLGEGVVSSDWSSDALHAKPVNTKTPSKNPIAILFRM